MGTIGDEATRAAVRSTLDDLHQYVSAAKIARFLIDVRGLEFVDSSAIRLFVDLTARAEASGYVVVFRVDPAVTWQRLSFSVLQTLAPRRIELQQVERTALP
jgi:hypothetical protein